MARTSCKTENTSLGFVGTDHLLSKLSRGRLQILTCQFVPSTLMLSANRILIFTTVFVKLRAR